MFEDTSEEFCYFLELHPTEKPGIIIRYLYWFYLEWCIENARKPVSRFIFRRTLGKIYKIQLGYKNEVWVYLDASQFPPITEEFMDMVDRDYNRERFGRKISKCLRKRHREIKSKT